VASETLQDINTAYWYRRASKPFCRTSLDEEWRAMTEALLRG
jgi:hypothetical protein